MKKSFLFAISTLVLLSFSSLCYSGGSMKPFGLYGGGGGTGSNIPYDPLTADWDAGPWQIRMESLHIDGTAPADKIYFGDKDVILYEPSDDTFSIFVAGSSYNFGTIVFDGSGTGFSLARNDALNLPTYAKRTDLDSGVSFAAGADTVSLVAGAVEGVRVSESAGVVTSDFPSGNVQIASDTYGLFSGASQDMSITYDGTDGKIITDLVAPSDLVVDCGTEKTLELAEPVWKDINIGSAFLSLPVATRPGEVELLDNVGGSTGIYTLGWADGEKASGVFEMQHDYKEGTDVYFHIHWQGNDAPSGTDNVKWQLTWTMAEDGQTLDPVTVIVVETAIDTQYEAYRSDFAAITGTNFDIGDQFLFLLERITAAGDAYLGEAVTFTIGAHYQVDTMGSRQAGVK